MTTDACIVDCDEAEAARLNGIIPQIAAHMIAIVERLRELRLPSDLLTPDRALRDDVIRRAVSDLDEIGKQTGQKSGTDLLLGIMVRLRDTVPLILARVPVSHGRADASLADTR